MEREPLDTAKNIPIEDITFVGDLNRFNLEEIGDAIYMMEYGLHSIREDEELGLADVLKKYYTENSVLKDFLLLKYDGSLYETSKFIDQIEQPDIKVLFCQEVISDQDSHFKKGRNTEELTFFLDYTIRTIFENNDCFQNLSFCSRVLELRSGENTERSFKKYFAEEKVKFGECHNQNILKILNSDPESTVYKSLYFPHLNRENVKKILYDLENRKGNFTVEDLNKITELAMFDERTHVGEITTEERKHLVDLINTRIDYLDPKRKTDVLYRLILFAGRAGYKDFFRAKMGQFYEEFSEISKNYTVDSRIDLLELLIEDDSGADLISSDIAIDIFDQFKWKGENIPKHLTTLFLADPANHADGHKMLKISSKNSYVKFSLLKHAYDESAISFERLAKIIAWNSLNAQEFISNENIPNDYKYSLLMKSAYKQLVKGEIDEFNTSLSQLEKMQAKVIESENSLVVLYSVEKFLDDLCSFAGKIKYAKENIKESDREIIKEKEGLAARAMNTVNKYSDVLLKLLRNEELLDSMDIYESSDFFANLNSFLLSVDNPLLNAHIKSYLERSFDRHMEFSRKHPDEFFGLYGASTEDAMNQLFADLGILSMYIESRKLIYKIDADGNSKKERFGFPTINKRDIKKIENDVIDNRRGETSRIVEKYIDFLLEMQEANAEQNKFFLSHMFSFGFVKHESKRCLWSNNRKLRDIFESIDARYYLHHIAYRYTKEQWKHKPQDDYEERILNKVEE